MAEYVKPVVFKVGGQLYGVDINLVQSIEKKISIVPVPNSNAYIKGIVNLRGDVIPVYSIKRKFNMPDDIPVESSIIVNAGEVHIALEVDEVIEIRDIDISNIVEMPRIVQNDDTKYMDRVANINGKLAILLDVANILTVEEIANVKKMTEDMK